MPDVAILGTAKIF